VFWGKTCLKYKKSEGNFMGYSEVPLTVFNRQTPNDGNLFGSEFGRVYNNFNYFKSGDPEFEGDVSIFGNLHSGGIFSLASGVGVNGISADGLLSGDSDGALVTEKAVKSYVDARISGHDTQHDDRFVKLTDYENSDVLGKIKAVDGSGSGLDADLLDGAHKDTDVNLSGNSDSSVPTEKAVKTYVDTKKTEAQNYANGLIEDNPVNGHTGNCVSSNWAYDHENNYRINKHVPVGTMIWWPTEIIPSGWLERNGASISRTTYADLFSVLGTRYGTADSGQFNLPDDRGLFIRGWSHGTGTDPDQTSRTKPSKPGASIANGDHVGTEQSDALQNHQHFVKWTCHTKDTGSVTLNGSPYDSNNSSAISATTIAGARVSSETRSKNRAYLPLIKY